MDPKLSNPNNQINQPVSNQPQNPTAPQPPVEPVIPVVNPDAQPDIIDQAPQPQQLFQQPTTLPPVQPPPIQNTPLPTMPQPSQSEPVAPPPDTNFDGLPKKSRISKKVAGITLVLFLAVTIPLTVFVTSQQQNIKSGAAPTVLQTNPVVVVFNGQQVHIMEQGDPNDIYHVALENYSADQLLENNNAALKNARDTWIERNILDLKAQELGLLVTESDINSLSSSTGISSTEAKYELLKQQIIFSQVNYVKAVSIGYWLPPASEATNYSTADQDKIAKQIQEGKLAMDRAYSQLDGQDPLTVAQSIYINPSYVDLKPVLALNVSKFAQLDAADLQTAAEPVLYEYGDTNFDTATRNLLFADTATVNKVVRGQRDPADTSSGGEVVFKVIDKGSGTFDSYKVWLEQQKSLLSKQPIPGIL